MQGTKNEAYYEPVPGGTGLHLAPRARALLSW